MKLHYFNQLNPDPDDELSRVARASGQVPSSCLLGGKTLDEMLSRSKDPCEACFGPRERCKGRPATKDKSGPGRDDHIMRLFTGGSGGPIGELLRRR